MEKLKWKCSWWNWLVIGLWFPCWAAVSAQSPGAPWDMAGDLRVHADFFKTTASNTPYYRPPFALRADFRSFLVKGTFSMPIEATLTLPRALVDTNHIRPQNVWTYLLAPANRVGLHPGVANFRAHIGAHEVELSPLTAGDIGLNMGMGVSYTPGPLRVLASYGIIQRHLRLNGYAQPERRILLAKMGIGDVSKTHLHLNYTQFWDQVAPPTSNRGAGSNMSLSFMLRAIPFLQMRGEFALGLQTTNVDVNAPASGRLLPNLPGTNASSVGDWAGSLALGITRRRGNSIVDIEALYVGANYHTASYLFMNAGHLDVTGRLNMQNKKRSIWVRGKAGWRWNYSPVNQDIRHELTSRHFIADVSGGLRLSKAVGVDGRFNNLEWWVESPDSFLPRQVSYHGEVHPYLQLGKKRRYLFMVGFEWEQYMDYRMRFRGNNWVTTERRFAEVRAYAKRGGALQLGVSSTNVVSNFPAELNGPADVVSGYLGLDKKLFKKKLDLGTKVLVSQMKFPVGWPNDALVWNIALRTKLARGTVLSTEANLRWHNMTFQNPYTAFFRTTLHYQF